MPMLSNRQRFDESFARSHGNLVNALAAIKAAKDDADLKRRQALQDKVTEQGLQQGAQSIQQNQMTLDKQQQEAGLVSRLTDHLDRQADPTIAGPALPEESGYSGPFSPKKYGDDFKYQMIAKLRTLRGKEATPEQVRSEYEASTAQNQDAAAAAAAAPKLRALDMAGKTASTERVRADTAQAQAETSKTKRETELLGMPKPGDSLEVAKFGRQLKQDFMGSQLTKDFQVIERTKNEMQSALTAWNARAATAAKEGKELAKGGIDQTLITLFNKLLDPSSVVRESEYARTPDGMSYLDKLQGKWDQFKSGGAGITPEFRSELIASANDLMAAAEDGFATHAQGYMADAQSYGIAPERVVGGYTRYLNHKAGPPEIPGVPKAGSLSDEDLIRSFK